MTVRGSIAGVALVVLAGALLAGCSANSFDVVVSRVRSDPAVHSVTENRPTIGPVQIAYATVKLKSSATVSDVERVAEDFRAEEASLPGTREGADVTIEWGARLELAEFGISRSQLKSEIVHWAALRKAIDQTVQLRILSRDDDSTGYEREFDIAVPVNDEPTAIGEVYAAAITVHDPSSAPQFWSVGYPTKPSLDDNPASSSIDVDGALPPVAVAALWQQVLGFETGPSDNVLLPDQPIVTSVWKAGSLALDLRYGQSAPTEYLPDAVAAATTLVGLGIPFHFTSEAGGSLAELDSPACADGATPGAATASGQLLTAIGPLPATVSAGGCS